MTRIRGIRLYSNIIGGSLIPFNTSQNSNLTEKISILITLHLFDLQKSELTLANLNLDLIKNTEHLI